MCVKTLVKMYVMIMRDVCVMLDTSVYSSFLICMVQMIDLYLL